jgi:hypothetical protein
VETKAILERIYEGKRKNIHQYPQHVVRASEIGHPCTRYLVYSITNWQDKAPHDAGLEFVFEGGRAVEDMAIKDFEDAGFKVYRPEPDKAIMESKPRITGHIDIRVDFGDNKVFTGEIKGLQIYDWEKLNSLEDFFKSRKPWIKKYPAQLMTYLYIKGEEMGFFYLKSIPRFQPKFIWVDLDLAYMESILKKAESVEIHVENKTFPDRIDDIEICETCTFKHICLPDMARKEMEFVIDDDFECLLKRREELKPLVSEYNDLDGDMKKYVGNREKLVVGDYMITSKEILKKGFTVMDSTYRKLKVVNMK